MSEAISLPTGAFAAMKAGQPMPDAGNTKAPANSPGKPDNSPKTVTRKPEKSIPLSKTDSPVLKTEPAEEKQDAQKQEIQRKIWKLKDGEEEYEYDATDEDRIKRDVMKARAADKRFKEAFETRQQAETFFNMLKDPTQLRKVLQDPRIGADMKKLAYDYVLEEMEEAKLTPEQKSNRDRDRKLAEYEDREKKDVERVKSEKDAVRTKELEGHYEQKIMAALKIKGVPDNHETVGRMADYLRRSIQLGYDLAPEELAHLIKNDTKSYLQTYASALSDDEFVDFLGEQNTQKVRSRDLRLHKSTQSNPFPNKQPPKSESKSQGKKKMYGSDWRKTLIDGFGKR